MNYLSKINHDSADKKKMPVLRIVVDDDAELQRLYAKHVCHHNRMTGNAGFDVFVAYPTRVDINSRTPVKISTGIRAEMVEDDGTFTGFDLVARSSICKTPIQMRNGIGIIDSDYRGVIQIPVIGVPPHSDDSVLFHRGARYFQLVHPSRRHFKVQIIKPEKLSKTQRGVLGFGSTGEQGSIKTPEPAAVTLK